MKRLALLTLALVTTAQSDPPTASTRAQNAEAARDPAFADRRDFEFAGRGFVATRADPIIKSADGRVVWDLSAFDFTKGEAPATVNPSLWRQSGLLARNGLFRVADRIWQVRGFDIANITFVRGDTGWIVIDPLTATETARAAYDLVAEKLGRRPVSALIYTHSHSDHFAGAGGVVGPTDQVPVVAPAGFLEAAVTENVIAGPAMVRRAAYQFGIPLAKGPQGSVTSGIGPAVAVGTQSLIPPTREIARTGEELVLDGVRIRFQLTPGTEAPAEMNLFFPDWNVLDMAENANPTQHNVLTPRGAVVRDAKRWAEGLTEAGELFAGADTLITSHGWPRFGKTVIAEYLAKHRDAYAFLHDQTVRLMNRGLTGEEIAARIKLPPALAREWYDRPYYGSLSFNARAVYQFYMGWYDANPARLAARTPEDRGKRYVAAIGGGARVMALARAAYDAGDYAWAAELLDRLVFAEPGHNEAKALLARCYDQLGWQSENSLWRNIYLTGSKELREGIASETRMGSAGTLAALPTARLFDLLAVRIDPEKVGTAAVSLAFVFPDRNESVTVRVANGVLIHRPGPATGAVDATITLSRADLTAALVGGVPLAPKAATGAVKIAGDVAALTRFIGWLDRPVPPFAIVTP